MIASAMKALADVPGVVAARVGVSWARLGVRETDGANRGRWVDAIVEIGGGDDERADPWCMFFAWACWHVAGLALGRRVVSRTSGSVISSWHRATAAERQTVPRVGDILCRVRKVSDLEAVRAGQWAPGHAEIVIRVLDGGQLWTVGGNTFDEDGAEGDGVHLHRSTYTLADPRLIGFIRPTLDRL